MTLANGKALRVAFGETVAELGKSDPRIVVLDGDLGSSTRADIFENAHPDRFFQMGIAEQNLLGAAAGMATVGFIPFVSTFACFAVARALDSIRVLIAQPKLNVKIVGGYSGLLAGMTGKTHLIFDDIAIMRAMPGMTVVVPADEVETRQAIAAITAYEGPVYLRLTRQASPLLFDDSYRFELGQAAVVRPGSDVTVFATGTQTVRAFEAAELLAAEGIDVHLVHVPTLKPLDADGIVAGGPGHRIRGHLRRGEHHRGPGRRGGRGPHRPLPGDGQAPRPGRHLRGVRSGRGAAGEVRPIGDQDGRGHPGVRPRPPGMTNAAGRPAGRQSNDPVAGGRDHDRPGQVPTRRQGRHHPRGRRGHRLRPGLRPGQRRRRRRHRGAHPGARGAGGGQGAQPRAAAP